MVIRTAARALIVHEGCVLIRYRDAVGILYALPGGGQDWAEPLPATLARECREELGLEVAVGQLAFVAEWVDPEQQVHQLECIFQCVPRAPVTLAGGSKPDSGELGVHWLPLRSVAAIRLYPLAMRAHLANLATADQATGLYLGAAP